jgi:hypothetical protein
MNGKVVLFVDIVEALSEMRIPSEIYLYVFKGNRMDLKEMKKLLKVLLREQGFLGGFQLQNLIITELKSHMTC